MEKKALFVRLLEANEASRKIKSCKKILKIMDKVLGMVYRGMEDELLAKISELDNEAKRRETNAFKIFAYEWNVRKKR